MTVPVASYLGDSILLSRTPYRNCNWHVYLGLGRQLPLLRQARHNRIALHSDENGRRKKLSISCKARTPSKTGKVQQTVSVPQSREDSVQQACGALSAQLADLGKKGKPTKGFKSSNVKRLTVEIPVADNSSASVVSLAEDLLRGLPPDVASSMILAFGNIEAALLASTKLQNQIIALDDVPEEPLAGPLLIVEPSVAQVDAAEELVKGRKGKLILLLNPAWTDGKDVPSAHAAFVKSFDVAYCFQPVAIRAFITTTQGAIFRRAVKGMSGLPAWQILKQGWGDNWKVIGQMQHRPSSQDLEMAFLNASAAESPITAGIKAVKGLVPGKKD